MNAHIRIGINELHQFLLSDDPVSAYENCASLLRLARQQPGTEHELLAQLQLLLTELASCWCKGLNGGRRHVYCQEIARWPLFRRRLN